MGFLVLAPQMNPRPSSEMASRKELTDWLTRVLFSTILPGSNPSQGPYRARLPNNLVAFIGLLGHLKLIGFPAHWLSEFLQSIISDSLVTEIPQYTGKLPIAVTEIRRRVRRRKVRLDPWRAEFETILATTLRGLPFAISLPPTFAQSFEQIGLFEAKVYQEGWQIGIPANDPVVSLIFYKPGQSVEDMLASIPAAFEGHKIPASGSFFILTALEFFDRHKTIRWRLSRERAQRMQASNWCMVAYRTDTKEPRESWFMFQIDSFLPLLLSSHPAIP